MIIHLVIQTIGLDRSGSVQIDAEHQATFQVAAEGRVLLTGRGIDLSGEQQTKTKSALRYFSRQLLNASA